MSRETILNVLRHQETEQVPWLPFVGVHAGSLVGCDAAETLTDGDKLFAGIVAANKLYAPDALPVLFDLQVEAEILGCDLLWAKEGPPSVSTHPLADSDEIPCDCLIPQKTDGRLPMILDVMGRAKEAIGQTVALYGLVCGPFTLASHLRGNNIFMDMYDDPAYVHNLLAFCAKVCRRMADFYMEAQMDVIAVVDPMVSQISPEAFEEFMQGPFTEIFKHIRQGGALSSFFVCGNATRNIEPMCKTAPDSIAVDENVNMVLAKEITDRYNITLGGNIPLTTVMLHGTQQDNMKYVVEELLDKLPHKNLIVSPGCDMPYHVPRANTIACGQALRQTESTRKMIADYHSSLLEGVEVALPDYAALQKPLVEVCTLDSDTCAACGYMMDAARVMKAHLGDRVDLVEYKFTVKENIARFVKMGVKNLPAIYINGRLEYSSLIPNREEFAQKVMDYERELK
jgi:uroporphyrinogen decarboxylase